MKRRRIMPFKNMYVNVSDVLSNKVSYDEDYIQYIIYDDRKENRPGDMKKMLEKINKFDKPNIVIGVINNLHPDSYKELVELRRKGAYNYNAVPIFLRNYNINVYKNDIPVHIKAENFMSLPIDVVEDVILRESDNFELKYFDDAVLDRKTFYQCVDFIARQIAKYAVDDVDKIILFNNMLRENVTFDWFSIDIKKDNEELREYAKSKGFKIYPSHSAQAVIRKQNAVCSGIASLGTILLRHPLLNVNINNLSGHARGGAHCFNEVIIDNVKYTCDFTHNITRDFDKGFKHLLVQRPSKTHTITIFGGDESDDFNAYKTIPRSVLEKKYERLKDVHILMPEFKVASFEVKYADEEYNDKKLK